MSENIELKWECLGNYFSDNANPKDFPSIKKKGVYLWTLINEQGEYIVVYVGKADNIEARLNQEKMDIKKGLATLYKLNKDDLVRTFIPEYDKNTDPSFIEKRSLVEKNTCVFIAAIDGDENPKQVEGALQIHLSKSSSTRRYLLTGISSYSLRGRTIKNLFQENLIIKGLESDIVISNNQ